MTENEIHIICDDYYIKDYTINPDMTIDVNGDVKLNEIGLTNLPIRFGKIYGDFFVYDNQLTTIEGCPSYINGQFYIHRNRLMTLRVLPVNFYIGDWCGLELNDISESKEYGRLFLVMLVVKFILDTSI